MRERWKRNETLASPRLASPRPRGVSCRLVSCGSLISRLSVELSAESSRAELLLRWQSHRIASRVSHCVLRCVRGAVNAERCVQLRAEACGGSGAEAAAGGGGRRTRVFTLRPQRAAHVAACACRCRPAPISVVRSRCAASARSRSLHFALFSGARAAGVHSSRHLHCSGFLLSSVLRD